jgi:hypothetical protein
MTGIDLPNTEDMNPDEASLALNKFWADAFTEGHPYMDPGHPQHMDCVNWVGEVTKIKTANEDNRPPLEKAMAEALDRQQEKQDALVAEAKAEMEKLSKLGFSADEIPKDIKEYQVNALRMQRLAAEGDFQVASDMLQAELSRMNVPPHIQSLFQAFEEAPDSERDFKESKITDVLKWFYNENKKRSIS